MNKELKKLKFSIIVATLNNENTLDRNLQSIVSQTYKDYEIIIIDGGSKDKTFEVIKKYNQENLKIKNQQGHGVYNAFNEGIRICTGDIVVILNADDNFSDDNSLSKIQKEFSNDKDLELLMTNIKMVNEKNKSIRIYDSKFFKPFMFYFGLMPPHPGIFVKKKVYNNFGLFDESFENAGDFEFLLRVILKSKINYKKMNDYLVSMSYGGKSNKNLKSFFKNTKEIKKALKINNYFSSYFLIMIRLIIKMFQFRF